MAEWVQLDLFEDVLARLPWRGQSPRALTKGAKGLFLSQEAQKSMRESGSADDGATCSLSPTKRGPGYAGAPLLIPLLEEDYDG